MNAVIVVTVGAFLGADLEGNAANGKTELYCGRLDRWLSIHWRPACGVASRI